MRDLLQGSILNITYTWFEGWLHADFSWLILVIIISLFHCNDLRTKLAIDQKTYWSQTNTVQTL